MAVVYIVVVCMCVRSCCCCARRVLCRRFVTWLTIHAANSAAIHSEISCAALWHKRIDARTDTCLSSYAFTHLCVLLYIPLMFVWLCTRMRLRMLAGGVEIRAVVNTHAQLLLLGSLR